MTYKISGAVALLLSAAAVTPATAQDGATASIADLRSEMTRNYDAALATTLQRDVIAADDSRYTWASEAKVACGIAIGYLKHRTRDEETIARCRHRTADLQGTPPAQQPPLPPPPGPPVAETPLPPPPPPATACATTLPVEVRFDWASAVPLPDSAATIESIAGSAGACGVGSLRLTGHADRSGSDGFNLRLSRRRAAAVAAAFTAEGFSRGALTIAAVGETDLAVPTADGVREEANRRVTIDHGGQK